ncbi:MAG TPA: DUF493 domain-containing protein [Gammaproteobacteria bacterium]|nr:DUF493 domain-containing protein [Gammaproteobacteria bacterium]
MPQPDSPLTFPARFPIKVMGRDAPEFRAAVVEIVARHAGGRERLEIETRPSRGGNFVALTVTFEAVSRAQVDAIYRELTAHELVLVAL